MLIACSFLVGSIKDSDFVDWNLHFIGNVCIPHACTPPSLLIEAQNLVGWIHHSCLHVLNYVGLTWLNMVNPEFISLALITQFVWLYHRIFEWLVISGKPHLRCPSTTSISSFCWILQSQFRNRQINVNHKFRNRKIIKFPKVSHISRGFNPFNLFISWDLQLQLPRRWSCGWIRRWFWWLCARRPFAGFSCWWWPWWWFLMVSFNV